MPRRARRRWRPHLLRAPQPAVQTSGNPYGKILGADLAATPVIQGDPGAQAARMDPVALQGMAVTAVEAMVAAAQEPLGAMGEG